MKEPASYLIWCIHAVIIFIHLCIIFIRNILENSDDERVNEAEDAVSEDSGWGNLFFLFSGQF